MLVDEDNRRTDTVFIGGVTPGRLALVLVDEDITGMDAEYIGGVTPGRLALALVDEDNTGVSFKVVRLLRFLAGVT